MKVCRNGYTTAQSQLANQKSCRYGMTNHIAVNCHFKFSFNKKANSTTNFSISWCVVFPGLCFMAAVNPFRYNHDHEDKIVKMKVFSDIFGQNWMCGSMFQERNWMKKDAFLGHVEHVDTNIAVLIAAVCACADCLKLDI